MDSNIHVEDQKVSLGCWIISGVGLVATGFMVWVFARVSQEQGRKPDYVLTISNIRAVPAILETEDPILNEGEVLACAEVSRKRSGA